MDPIYPDFPTAASIPQIAPLTPDRLDPDQRREQDTGSQRRKKSDAEAEDEADEAVTEDLSSSEAASAVDAPRKVRRRGDLRRDGDGDGHIDITV